jgi:hypothetical protein
VASDDARSAVEDGQVSRGRVAYWPGFVHRRSQERRFRYRYPYTVDWLIRWCSRVMDDGWVYDESRQCVEW